ncbi:kinase-like protein [Suillus weaverae]|nr:kinase-like protein [Suillus weaverae]
MDAQSGSDHALPLDTIFSSGTTHVDVPHSSPQLAAQPQIGTPLRTPGITAPSQTTLALLELRKSKISLINALNDVERGILAILAQTGDFPDDSSTGKLEDMCAEIQSRNVAMARKMPVLPELMQRRECLQCAINGVDQDLTGLITRCSQYPVCCGTYGNIYKCIYHGPDGDVEVAVKAIRPGFFSARAFRRELGMWKRLRHSNILKFMGTTREFGLSEAFVAPWIANGTLTSFLDHNNETLGLRDRLRLLSDIASGLDYLHTFNLTECGHTDPNPIVHGDLTGTNVLIDSDGKAYLADFGLAGTINKLTGMTYLAKLSCRPGGIRWTAPELLSGEEPASAATTRSDMYSFGLNGSCHLTNDTAILLKVFEGKIHPRPDARYVTDQHWNFMTSCWSTIPIGRPSAVEALQFVAREISLLRLNGGLVADISVSNDRFHTHTLACNIFQERRRKTGINSWGHGTMDPGFQWMDQINLYNHSVVATTPAWFDDMSPLPLRFQSWPFCLYSALSTEAPDAACGLELDFLETTCP